jgi:hypothetical protein
MSKVRHLGVTAVWGWPVVLGVLTCIGLVSALFSDAGFGDLLASICLGAPVAVGVWFGWLRRSPGSKA